MYRIFYFARKSFSGLLLICLGMSSSFAGMNCFKQAYPDAILTVSDEEIIWKDGTQMSVDNRRHNQSKQEALNEPSLYDQMNGVRYEKGIPRDVAHFVPLSDTGRIRYEPFFLKMYGQTKEEVESHLVTVYWMPRVFGYQYPLEVTIVNGVNHVFEALSHDLEEWVFNHPEDLPFLGAPAGTYHWRKIANTNRQSMHSFGMTLDLRSDLTEYWQNDLAREGRPITEEEPLLYHNHVPWALVQIFESHGFIWGGKWVHFDSQHFEYRPELFC